MAARGLSKRDLAAYERDGVVHLRNVLTAQQVNGLREAVAQQMREAGESHSGYDFESIGRQVWAASDQVEVGSADRFDMQIIKNRVLSDPAARPLLEEGEHSAPGTFFYDVAGWRRFEGVRQAAFHSALPDLVASLLDTEYLNFWEDTTFVKAPGTRQKTAFHQDYAFFQITGRKCAVVWIPLDPVSVENGMVEYVRGSHRWGKTFAPNLVISQTPTTNAVDERLPDIEAHRDEYDIVSFNVEPGDVVIHDVMTIHGAGGNMSDRNRRAISFRYCGDDIRYFDRPGAIPQSGVSHALENGARLFCDDYPLVWPRGATAESLRRRGVLERA